MTTGANPVPVPWIVAALFNGVLPFSLVASLYPAELATAAFYGLWTALLFSVVPVGSAHDTPVSALFRDRVEGGTRKLRRRFGSLSQQGFELLLDFVHFVFRGI